MSIIYLSLLKYNRENKEGFLNMKRDLFLRTDVLPEEIPLLFSNKNVYLNFSEAIIRDEYPEIYLWKKETIPLFFDIPKGYLNEKRKISLIHPIAQIQAFIYVIHYEQLIVAHSKKSEFSVRAPIKRNFPKLLKNSKKEKGFIRIQQEYGFADKFPITTDEDLVLFYNYFSLSRFKKITGLVNSPTFRRTQYKFNYFRKLDIQNFFPSIYTHSLSWALFGSKAIGKKYSSPKYIDTFPNQTDKVMQRINFNETNGIVVGPEFSRIVSELLLIDVDSKLLAYLENQELYHKKDYVIYRFLDDYYIFTNEPVNVELIENKLRILLREFNLSLNTNKSQLQKKPFKISNGSISELRTIINHFEQAKLVSHHQAFEKNRLNGSESYEMKMPLLKYYKGTRAQWNDLFVSIELLIDKYPEDRSKVVHYFLKTIRTQIEFDGKQIRSFRQMLEIITNIFTLNITTKSTNYLIAISFKILNKVHLFEDELKKSKDNSEYDLLIEQKKDLNEISSLKEVLYQHLFRIMKNNIENMDDMYDLLVFMKSLDKKLPSSFLSAIIERHKDSYFVLCSVGYYILDVDLNKVDSQYITVRSLLNKRIYDFIDNYESHGIKNEEIIFESSYFYMLNDFSKYPGFEEKTRKNLNAILKKSWMKSLSQKESKQKGIEIWSYLTSLSYYQWNETSEKFIRKIVKKSSNIGQKMDTGDYN